MTRRSLPAARSSDFVPVPRTTPAIFALDPRQEAEHAAPR